MNQGCKPVFAGVLPLLAVAVCLGYAAPAVADQSSFQIKMVAASGEVGLCGTCLAARGIEDGELVPGATRKTLGDLASWTAEADKVLVF